MDKKKKVAIVAFISTLLFGLSALSGGGQNVSSIRLMEREYEYGVGKDSITLYFNLYDESGMRLNGDDAPLSAVGKWLEIQEKSEKKPVDNNKRIFQIGSGKRIPNGYTFSVLVDQSIPEQGKMQIYDAVETLVESAPDSCVFLSFFGDNVTSSQLVTRGNIKDWKDRFAVSAKNKYFYSAIYAKLSEFSANVAPKDHNVIMEEGYRKNAMLADRATRNQKETLLFVFTEGHTRPTYEEEIGFVEVTELQSGTSIHIPRVYAFYYTENGDDPKIAEQLEGICTSPSLQESRRGDYKPANNMTQVLQDFEEIINEKSYDYAFRYLAYDKIYTGAIDYVAFWKGNEMGEGSFSIGSPERPWPERPESTSDWALKLLMAVLIAIGSFALYFLVMKIIIPWIQSLLFERKYYKHYVPEPNVQRRVCHYCKQEIQEGQRVVVKCSHIMHVHCWKQNGYKCSEYGQNCKSGIQSHVHWSELWTRNSFRDSFQIISGIAAAFVSWLVFELCGRGGFPGLSKGIVNLCLGGTDSNKALLAGDCIAKTSAFLMIGLLLGFFLSLVFRYNDEYRRKDWKIVLKIIGLSLMTGIIGMIAFILGSMVFCWLVSAVGATYIPWYCSLPAYIFFSLAVALSLTIKSSIPMKSALMGGGISAIIGFIVLWISSMNVRSWGWMNVLLDFIIYGGGLGASLVTVRMMSEKYFLIIKNGVRAGQKIPIHKWMNATGGGKKVSIGMTGECEIQMNWEKSNKVAKEHAVLYVDQEKKLPTIKPLATNVLYNNRLELSVGKPYVLSNDDVFKIGDTIFQYVESE